VDKATWRHSDCVNCGRSVTWVLVREAWEHTETGSVHCYADDWDNYCAMPGEIESYD
jgi:hypothetical protein